MYNSQLVINRIDTLLSLQNVPKTQLNEYCGISRNTFSQAKGRPNGLSAKILYDAADFLNCSVDYLLGRSDTPQIAENDLNDDEAELVELYRKLSPREQGDIFGRVDTLATLHEKSFKQEKA